MPTPIDDICYFTVMIVTLQFKKLSNQRSSFSFCSLKLCWYALPNRNVPSLHKLLGYSKVLFPCLSVLFDLLPRMLMPLSGTLVDHLDLRAFIIKATTQQQCQCSFVAWSMFYLCHY